MVSFLEAVGVKFNGWVPYFASCLILELHEVGKGQFFTELWIFNNTEDGFADKATQVPIPGMNVRIVVIASCIFIEIVHRNVLVQWNIQYLYPK